jgi:hypothetical protein
MWKLRLSKGERCKTNKLAEASTGTGFVNLPCWCSYSLRYSGGKKRAKFIIGSSLPGFVSKDTA